jgi:hypothetical protein
VFRRIAPFFERHQLVMERNAAVTIRRPVRSRAPPET